MNVLRPDPHRAGGVAAALVMAGFMAMLWVLAIPGGARADDVVCGPAGNQYRCGAILVVLQEATTDGIADVIGRQGGDPTSDLLQQFTAVRDILAPGGVAEDTSAATVYQVRVSVGTEEDAAAQYSTDAAVYAAAVDRETIGTLTPNGAMTVPGVDIGSWALVTTGICLLLAAFVAAFARESRSTSR